MSDVNLILIEENASLASSLTDLLEAEGYRVLHAKDLAGAVRVGGMRCTQRPAAILVASNAHFSRAVNDWKGGRFSDLPMIMVGSRNPSLHTAGRFHVVTLPLDVLRFLELLAELAPPASGEGPWHHLGQDAPAAAHIH